MPSHFYAYMARMKLIKRWNLRRNTREENDQEHSLQVAMISHALAVIRNRRYGGALNLEKVMLLAVYHEAPEVITGDVATPVKYSNPGIRDAFKSIEKMAAEQLLMQLPWDLREDYRPLLLPDDTSPEWKVVKAADRISAYLKCLEEEGYGNQEFLIAKQNIERSIKALAMPEVDDFMNEFAPSFMLPLDGLN